MKHHRIDSWRNKQTKTFKQIDNSSDKLRKSVGRVSEIVRAEPKYILISSCTNIILSGTGFYLAILWKIYLFRQSFFAMLYRHTGGRQA